MKSDIFLIKYDDEDYKGSYELEGSDDDIDDKSDYDEACGD